MELVSAPKIRMAVAKRYRVEGDEVFGPKGKLKPQTRFGPPYVCVRFDGRSRKVPCHALAAYQKFGERIFEPGVFVRHMDGDENNFATWNIGLGQGKASLNSLVRVAHARRASEAVTVHDHGAIIDARKKGMSYKQIMEKFNISSKGTVSYIINKNLWAASTT